MIETGLVRGFFGFLAYAATVLLLLRLLRQTSPVAVVMVTAPVVCLLTLVTLAVAGPRINIWAFGISYWFFVTCFLMVFGALYKSLSLRMLLDLSRRPNHADNYDTLLVRYIAEESFQNRLNVMRKKGYSEKLDGRIALTDRGRRLAAMARSVQRAFNIEKSG